MFSAVYAEGVAPHSPGLTASAGYPGDSELEAIIYPEGVASDRPRRRRNPFGVQRSMIFSPRVARSARNPGLCDSTPSA